MKNIATVLLLVAVVSADEWKPNTVADMFAAHKVCLTRVNISAEKLVLQYSTWSFPDDDVTGSYFACLFKEIGFFCDHQGFHTDRLIAQYQFAYDIDIKPNVDECVAKTDADTTNDRWVLRAFKCFTAPHSAKLSRPQSRAADSTAN